MQSLERDAMRSLIILLFLTAARGFTIPLKGGDLEIEDVNENLITVTLTKHNSTIMRNIFYTRSAKSTTQQNSPVLENDGDNKVRVKYAISETKYEVDASRETIVITRTLGDPAGELIDCFELADDTQWFGGPELRRQSWPVQNMYFVEEPYLPTHPGNMAIAERYWLSSKGVYIYVNETSPLFLDQNNYRDKYLCMIAKNKAPYQHRNNIELKYTIGVFPDPKAAHQYAVKNHLGHPTGRPNERMIKSPIWSTWARYKANINATVVEAYADEINAHGFSNSQIEIDDKWETCYGSAKFDGAKFLNVRALIQRLKQKGFRVTLWIHPFINRDCEPAYSTAFNNSYFVKNLEGNVRMSWWQGSEAATIDFTNPNAVAWWVERLRSLVALGIDSFKFDAGEVDWLPQTPMLNGSPELQPGIFTQEYVRILAASFGDMIEVRVGWRTQELPVFVRMIDKDTKWSWDNGLPTLITTLLQMNLNGYVYVLPDMIGGNGYLDGSLNGTEYPSKEIFIRWLQANVFMPSLQYSFVPWYYDNDTVNLCKYYTDLHADLTPEIQIAMQLAVDNGTPVNPPIWWIDPNDTEAHKINDEYLLGDKILVAPVTKEGAESRNIYLPEGMWLDMNYPDEGPYEGRRWLNDYHAPLEILPYFKKQ